MNEFVAKQIAKYLNEYNNLDKYFIEIDILNEADKYLYILNDHNKLVGAVKLIKFDWYLGGIKHLTVNEKERRKGYGISLLEKAEEEAYRKKIRVLQSTVRKNDLPSIKCFKKFGYKNINCFFNERTKNQIYIFQKVLNIC